MDITSPPLITTKVVLHSEYDILPSLLTWTFSLIIDTTALTVSLFLSLIKEIP